MTANSFLAAKLLVAKFDTKLETLTDLVMARDSKSTTMSPKGNYNDFHFIFQFFLIAESYFKLMDRFLFNLNSKNDSD